MREIKFRAKRLDNGEWAYGSGVVFCDDFCFLDKNDECYIEELYTFRGNTHFIKLACIQCDDKTIGQYTGLKDKNGKEIYEGDILLTPFVDAIFGDMIGEELCVKREVSFNDGSFVVKDEDLHPIYLECFTRNNYAEVIDNIYDNKSLLKE